MPPVRPEFAMPIYEYHCPECDTIFEEWAKASEMKEVAPCPQCQTSAERIISHTAFVLKGGGWYVTDYGYRKNISEDSAAAGSAGSAAVPPAATAHTAAEGTAPAEASGSSSGGNNSPSAASTPSGAGTAPTKTASPPASNSSAKAPTGAPKATS